MATGYRIDRALLGSVERCLATRGGVFLNGPYEVGKSELAGEIARRFGGRSTILNGSAPSDRTRIFGEEDLLRRQVGGLIVLDQLHDCPEAADFVRQQLQSEQRKGAPITNFLLLGSKATEVQAIVASKIGTHIAKLDLSPISLEEIQPALPAAGEARIPSLGEVEASEPISRSNIAIDPLTLWLRGGFPRSLFAASDSQSLAWRRAYIDQLINKGYRHINPLVSASTFRTLLERLAAGQGEIFDERARDVHQGCVDHLVDLGLVRLLRPWWPNAMKRYARQPKMFLRDSGLLHALLNRHSITDIARDGVVLGHSWEGFCIENLIEAAPGAIPYFYRDDQQNEIDLVLDFGEDRRLAIEIKSESARISDGFDSAVREIRPIDSYVVRPIDEGFTDGKNRRIVGLLEMIGIVRSIASRSVLAAH